MKRSIVILYRDLCEEWIDLLEAGGFNTLGLHFVPREKDRENTMEDYLDWLEREGHAMIRRIEAKGIAVEHELHALTYLLPREEFAAHPEWFRVDKEGARTPKHNLCPSSVEALRMVEERTYALATRLKQSGHRYYLWSDDATDSWCHCAACREKSNSDQNITILRHILAGLRRYDAQAELCYLAYLGVIEPPTEPIPEGIFLEYAPIKRNMFKPLIDEENLPHRKAVERLLETFPAKQAEILEYWLDVSFYTKWGKLPPARVPYIEEVLRADFEYYSSLGVGAIKTFGAYMDRDYLKRFGDKEIVDYGRLLKKFSEK